MSYSPEVYRAAEDELSRRRTEAEQRANALRARMTAQNPRIAELELMMRASAAEVARAVVNGGNVEEVVAEMRRRNETAQKELADILLDFVIRARPLLDWGRAIQGTAVLPPQN